MYFDSCVFDSDMPFPIGDLHPRKAIEGASFTAPQKRSIFGGTAQGVFRIRAVDRQHLKGLIRRRATTGIAELQRRADEVDFRGRRAARVSVAPRLLAPALIPFFFEKSLT
jgi:hypothetical protein